MSCGRSPATHMYKAPKEKLEKMNQAFKRMNEAKTMKDFIDAQNDFKEATTRKRGKKTSSSLTNYEKNIKSEMVEKMIQVLKRRQNASNSKYYKIDFKKIDFTPTFT